MPSIDPITLSMYDNGAGAYRSWLPNNPNVSLTGQAITSGTSIPTVTTGTTDFNSILYYENFTGGVNGNGISTVSDWITLGSGTCVLGDDPLGQQGKVAVDSVLSGQKSGALGGVYTPSVQWTSGDEVWLRIKLYMPLTFSYVASPWLKFFRFRVRTSGGGHVGFDDMYCDPVGDWRFIFEGENNWNVLTTNQAFAPTKGQWQDWEMHLVFDNVPVSEGGNARMDFWRDGALVGTVLNRRTLNSDTDQMWSIYFQDYWNGGSPQDQTWYWTKTAVAAKIAGVRDDTSHLSTDDGGRLFIGLGGT